MGQVVDSNSILQYIELKGIDKDFETFLARQNISKDFTYFKMTINSIAQICKKINKRFQSQDSLEDHVSKKSSGEWRKGEFKLFIWLSFFYAFKENKHIHQFKDTDFLFLKSVFQQRTICRIKFQIINLFPNAFYPKTWEEAEISMLMSFVHSEIHQQKKPEWKSIAFRLFQQSKGVYFKTFGQCREMWTNHLDPNVSKQKWTLQEDQLLLNLVKGRTNKYWSKIAQKFKGKRTVHMVRNRYNSFILQGKRTNKKLTQKQITNRLLKSIALKLKKQRKTNEELRVQNSKITIDSSNTQSQIKSTIGHNFNELVLLPGLQFQGIDSFQIKNQAKNIKTSEIQNLLNNLYQIDANFCHIQRQLHHEDFLQKMGGYNLGKVYQGLQEGSSYDFDIE